MVLVPLLVVFAPQVPPVGVFAGIRVGVDTREMMERRLGPGFAFTGGHPRGARSWQAPKQGWIIACDGFEWDPKGRGLLLDYVELSAGAAPNKIPVARNVKWGLYNSFTPQMSRDEVVAILRTQNGKLFIEQDQVTFIQKGHFDVHHGTNPEVDRFRSWRARFTFEDLTLSGILIEPIW